MVPRFAVNALFLVLLFAAGAAGAQTLAPDTVAALADVQITASVDKLSLYIGDRVRFNLTIVYDSTYRLIPPPIAGALKQFEVKEYRTDIISVLENGDWRSESWFDVTAYRVGAHTIPAVPVTFELPDGRQRVVKSEPISLTVKSLLSELYDTIPESLDVRPLKAQLTRDEFEKPPFPWLYVIAGSLFLSGVAVLLWLRRGYARRALSPIDRRTPWETAFEELAVLGQKHYPARQMYKEYYFELTEILRAYLGRMYSINALDMTTSEFMQAVRTRFLPDSFDSRLESLLRHADLVKFAKMVPAQDRPQQDYQETHDLIELVRRDHDREHQPVIAREGEAPPLRRLEVDA